MRLGKSMMLGAVLSFAVGCGGNGAGNVEDTEYVEALPDLAGVSLEISGSASEQGAALTGADFGVYEAALAGSGPEFLEGARMKVQALNGALKQAVTQVVALANGDLKEAEAGDVLTYGPKDGANATFLLKVKKQGAGRFAWKLEARPLGSEDEAAYKVVAVGRMVRGTEPHRGRGSIGLNLDNLKAVAPATTGEGKLLASFAHPATGGKALAYRLVGFTPNVDNHEPVTGAFVGHKLEGGATRIRIFGKHNLAQTATEEKETVFSRIAYKPGVGGRADIVAKGGDIAEGVFYIGSACWDAQEQELFKVLRQCTVGQPLTSCEQVFIEGERTACPAAEFRGDVEPPSQEPGSATPEPGAPETPDEVPSDVVADF